MEAKLEELVRRDDETHPGQDPAKVPLLRQVAETYRKMGQPDKAIPHFQRAVAILVASETSPSFERAFLLCEIAMVYNVCGRHREARGALLEAIFILEREYPDRTAEIYSAKNNLASTHLLLDAYDEAEQLFLELLALAERGVGTREASIAASHHQLGYLYMKKREFSKAERSLGVAVSMKRRLFGDGHPQVGMTLNVLAGLYDALGRPEAAQVRADSERMMKTAASAPYRKVEPVRRRIELRCLDRMDVAASLIGGFITDVGAHGFAVDRVFTVGESHIYTELVLPPIITVYIDAKDLSDETLPIRDLASRIGPLVARFRAAGIDGYGSGDDRKPTNDAAIFVRTAATSAGRYYFRPGEYSIDGVAGIPSTLPAMAARVATPGSTLRDVAIWIDQRWQVQDPTKRMPVPLE